MKDRETLRESQTALTELLTPVEVGRLLGVSLTTVKRLTAVGDLPHVRVSTRRPRYHACDVLAFIDCRRTGGTSGEPHRRRNPAGEPGFAKPAGDGGGDDER